MALSAILHTIKESTKAMQAEQFSSIFTFKKHVEAELCSDWKFTKYQKAPFSMNLAFCLSRISVGWAF